MKSYRFFCFSTLFILLLLNACFEGHIAMPSVTGKAGDVIFVCTPQIKESEAGKEVMKCLRQSYPGLFSHEPMFDLQYLTPESFNTPMFRPARNIVEIDVARRYTEAKLVFRKNIWAQPQSYARLQAPDEVSLLRLVREKAKDLIPYFQNADRQLYVNYHGEFSNFEYRSLLKSTFNMDMVVPASLNKKKEADNFLWFSNGKREGAQSMVFFSVPYTGPSMVSPEHLQALCDSVSQLHMPGHTEGSYKVTGTQVPVTYNHVSFRGKFCVEMRGMWRVEGDMMGGPFVRWFRVDEELGRLVVAEIFVYAPEQAKRNLVMLLEAQLYSWLFKYEENTTVSQGEQIDSLKKEDA